jgi:hypothetical protein
LVDLRARRSSLDAGSLTLAIKLDGFARPTNFLAGRD